jgi:nucleotide-binding universal stress UspA family protein
MMDKQVLAHGTEPFAPAPAEVGALLSQLLSFLDDWAARYSEARVETVNSVPSSQNSAEDIAGVARRVDDAIGELAAACYAERRRRDRAFEGLQLFGEPAWDILLDVAAAEAKGDRLQVTSVCIGACVPETTALRWIGVLERRGLLRREHDLTDQRRSFVRLTTEGARRLRAYFAVRGSDRAATQRSPFMLGG